MTCTIAYRVAEFAHACVTSPAHYPSADVLAMAQQNARANGGKARTSAGRLLGYRFPDGSAVTASCVEYLGTFPSESRLGRRA